MIAFIAWGAVPHLEELAGKMRIEEAGGSVFANALLRKMRRAAYRR